MSEFGRMLHNGVNLKCPAWRHEPLFHSFLRMPEKCGKCGYVYEREPGYFIGAIYINMIVTLLTVVLGFYAALWLLDPRLSNQIIFWGLFSVVFPVLFFRTTRGLWVNFDYYITGKSGSHEHPSRGIKKEGK